MSLPPFQPSPFPERLVLPFLPPKLDINLLQPFGLPFAMLSIFFYFQSFLFPRSHFVFGLSASEHQLFRILSNEESLSPTNPASKDVLKIAISFVALLLLSLVFFALFCETLVSPFRCFDFSYPWFSTLRTIPSSV